MNSVTTIKNEIATQTQQTITTYLANALADNTKQAYKKWIDSFVSSGYLIPAKPADVLNWLASLCKRDGSQYSHQSINQALAAIGYAHTLLNAPNPCKDGMVKTYVAGFKRTHGTKATRQAKPILKDNLIETVRKPRTLVEKRDNALILLGFWGAFRRSELASLELSNIQFTSEGCIVTLAKSKANQTGKLEEKFIPKRGDKLCPINALREWIVSADITDGKLFRSLNRHGKVGLSLTPFSIGAVIKNAFQAIESEGILKISGHSLRVGFITTCALARVASAKIQSVTGHKTQQMISHYSRVAVGFDSYPEI